MTKRNLFLTITLGALGLAWCGAICCYDTAQAQVSRPNPTATPQADPAAGFGVPQPSAAPSCAAGGATLYGDLNGNIYACAGTSRVLVARGGAAVFATATATATVTPTPTVTATP